MVSYFVVTVDIDPPIPSSYGEIFIEHGVNIFLKLFEKYLIKATFFVPASVAENFPDAIQKTVKMGHEIACHGLKHEKKEATLDVEKQIKNIKNATEIIQTITKERPVGFRAPLFNINRNCWIALQKNDYVYDSSIVNSPFYRGCKNPLSGKPFLLLVSKDSNLLEVPISVNPILLFPLGGAYLRVLGTKWCKVGIKMNLLYKNPIVFHIHPKDVISTTWGVSWWCYKNTEKGMKMLKEILNYLKQTKVKFLTAYELAKLYERKISLGQTALTPKHVIDWSL